MSPYFDLEERLRRGLDAAGRDVPDFSLAPLGRRGRVVSPVPAPHSRQRRWVLTAVASGVAAASIAAGVAVVTAGGGRDQAPSEVSVAGQDQVADDTVAPHSMQTTNGRVPGQAVVSDGELRTYGPDGSPTGSLDLAPWTNIQAASSDLQGGWVICGETTMGEPRPEVLPESTESISWAEVLQSLGTDRIEAIEQELEAMADTVFMGQSQLVWFRAGSDPVVLDYHPPLGICYPDSVNVVDSPQGPTALVPTAGSDLVPSLQAVVLSTGEVRDLDLAIQPSHPYAWSATSDRVLSYGRDTGFQLVDLDSGAALPIGPIDADPTELELSADGTTVAMVSGPVMGPVNLTVVDLATGTEVYRTSLPDDLEGFEMSFDGTTIAVGSRYPDEQPVRVIDLATGAERTIDTSGVLL